MRTIVSGLLQGIWFCHTSMPNKTVRPRITGIVFADPDTKAGSHIGLFNRLSAFRNSANPRLFSLQPLLRQVVTCMSADRMKRGRRRVELDS